MNQHMYRTAPTKANLARLIRHGNLICGPDTGKPILGDMGPGRTIASLSIVELADRYCTLAKNLHHLNIKITAGPTREVLDPVRFITNHSSGKK